LIIVPIDIPTVRTQPIATTKLCQYIVMDKTLTIRSWYWYFWSLMKTVAMIGASAASSARTTAAPAGCTGFTRTV